MLAVCLYVIASLVSFLQYNRYVRVVRVVFPCYSCDYISILYMVRFDSGLPMVIERELEIVLILNLEQNLHYYLRFTGNDRFVFLRSRSIFYSVYFYTIVSIFRIVHVHFCVLYTTQSLKLHNITCSSIILRNSPNFARFCFLIRQFISTIYVYLFANLFESSSSLIYISRFRGKL